MPFTKSEQLRGEPIVISTLEGYIGPIDAIKAANANAEYLEQNGGYVFSIIDARRMTTTFPELMMIIRNAGQGRPGSTTDPHVQVILVGTSEFARLFKEAMERQQSGALQIPMFTELDDAIHYARTTEFKK